MSVLLHWVHLYDTWGQYTSVRPSIYCYRSVLLLWVPVFNTMRTVHIPEAKYLLLDVSTTALSPIIWHMRSVHISEAKYLLIEVSTTTLSPSIWHNEDSTHPWGQVSTARGKYYYLEAQYLTQLGQYTSLRPSFYCSRSVLLHWVPISNTWSQYTSLR